MFKNNKPVRVSSINNAHADKLKSDLITAQNKIKELQSVLDMEHNNKFSYDVELKKIKLGKNCRDINNLAVEELQESIKEQGQLQPVLISSDSYLICGFRRYKAISNLNHQTIFACRLDKNYKQLQKNLLTLQYMENEKRQSLDNFEIGHIFNELIKQGLTQVQLCEMFKKDKSFVSKVVMLNNINPDIIKLIKEIEHLGVSENKLNAYNLKPKKFTPIGINSLYQIASKKDETDMKETFVSMFKNKLTEDEYNIYHDNTLPLKQKDNKKDIEKKLSSINKYVIDSLYITIEKKEKIISKLQELEELLK